VQQHAQGEVVTIVWFCNKSGFPTVQIFPVPIQLQDILKVFTVQQLTHCDDKKFQSLTTLLLKDYIAH